MVDTANLVEGAFYWVLIVYDPDAAAWENELMPARYAGNERWNFIGEEDVSDWPVRLIGPRIDNPSERSKDTS